MAASDASALRRCFFGLLLHFAFSVLGSVAAHVTAIGASEFMEGRGGSCRNGLPGCEGSASQPRRLAQDSPLASNFFIQRSLAQPTFVFVDPLSNNISVVDQPTGIWTLNGSALPISSTLLIDGTLATVRDGERFVNISLRSLDSLTIDESTRDIYLSASDQGIVVRAKATNTGIMNLEMVVNALGQKGSGGDCGPATMGKLRSPRGLAIVPPMGTTPKRLIIADSGNDLVREVSLTAWPSCLGTVPSTCSEEYFINRSSGQKCRGLDCFFTTITPDACAFECYIFNTGRFRFPTRSPVRDVVLSESEFRALLFDGYINVTNVYLEQGSAALRAYTLQKNFTTPSGEILNASTSHFVGLWKAQSVRRFNQTELTSTDLPKNLFQNFQKMTFRFLVSGLPCRQWSWLLRNLTTRAGSCYMMPFAENISCPLNKGATAVGVAECRPGSIQTLVGTRNPSSGLTPARGGHAPRQLVGLKNPRQVLYYQQSADSNPALYSGPKASLLISDSGNGRILGLPLGTLRVQVVRFWLFIGGPMRFEYAVNETTASAIFIRSLLNIGAEALATLKVIDPQIASQRSASSLCTDADVTEPADESELKALSATACNLTCSKNAANSCFQNASRCVEACSSCWADCGRNLTLIHGFPGSWEKCQARKAYLRCVEAKEECTAPQECNSSQTARDDFWQITKDALDAELMAKLDETCKTFTNKTEVYPCRGCDSKIFGLLGGDPAYYSNESTDQVVGVLLEADIPDTVPSLAVSTFLQNWRNQESYITQIGGTFPASQSPIDGCPNDCVELFKIRRLVEQIMRYVHNSSMPDVSNFSFGVSAVQRIGTSNVSDWTYMIVRSRDSVFSIVEPANQYSEATVHKDLVQYPEGMSFDRQGRLYFADSLTRRLLRADDIWNPGRNAQDVTSVAGNGYDFPYTSLGEWTEVSPSSGPLSVSLALDGVAYLANNNNDNVLSVTGLSASIHCTESPVWYNRLTDATPEDANTVNNSLFCREVQLHVSALIHMQNCFRCNNGDQSCNNSWAAVACGDGAERNETGKLKQSVSWFRSQINNETCARCPSVSDCLGIVVALSQGEIFCEENSSNFGCMSRHLSVVFATAIMEAITSLEVMREQVYCNTYDQYASPESALTTAAAWINETNTCQEENNVYPNISKALLSNLVNGQWQDIATASEALKSQVCPSENEMNIPILMLSLWHYSVLFNCLPAASKPSQLIGAALYSRMSIAPKLIMGSRYNESIDDFVISPCQKRCGPLQPLLFDMWTGGPAQCCGRSAGYLCGEGEGVCTTDTDCNRSYFCKPNSCSWSPEHSCCSRGSDSDQLILQKVQAFGAQSAYFVSLENSMWR